MVSCFEVPQNIDASPIHSPSNHRTNRVCVTGTRFGRRTISEHFGFARGIETNSNSNQNIKTFPDKKAVMRMNTNTNITLTKLLYSKA